VLFRSPQNPKTPIYIRMSYKINHSSSESMRQIGAASADGLCKIGAAALSVGAEGSVDFRGLSLDCELSGEFLRFGPLA